MDKIQINFIDAIQLHGKISIGHKDKNGNDLFVGDTLKSESGDIDVIGYRYGEIALVPPFGMHTMTVKSYSNREKTNEFTVVQGKFLIIGYDNEPFFKQNADALSGVEMRRIPQS